MGRAGSPAGAIRGGLGWPRIIGVFSAAAMFNPVDPIWIFLARRRFPAKTPELSGWKTLDFLGFSRPNLRLINGLRGIFVRKLFAASAPDESSARDRRKRCWHAQAQVAHAKSLLWLLIFSNLLLLTRLGFFGSSPFSSHPFPLPGAQPSRAAEPRGERMMASRTNNYSKIFGCDIDHSAFR